MKTSGNLEIKNIDEIPQLAVEGDVIFGVLHGNGVVL